MIATPDPDHPESVRGHRQTVPHEHSVDQLQRTPPAELDEISGQFTKILPGVIKPGDPDLEELPGEVVVVVLEAAKQPSLERALKGYGAPA
ncbi:MAG TPA: hypothetical protein VGS60_15105 [Actinomycetes bacterium]|jgi:hypothetical protein|nr:hypothetical protein [Actinomycetes bacterium]